MSFQVLRYEKLSITVLVRGTCTYLGPLKIVKEQSGD